MGGHQRIAIVFFVGSLVYEDLDDTTTASLSAGTLIGDRPLMTLVPVPGIGTRAWSAGRLRSPGR